MFVVTVVVLVGFLPSKTLCYHDFIYGSIFFGSFVKCLIILNVDPKQGSFFPYKRKKYVVFIYYFLNHHECLSALLLLLLLSMLLLWWWWWLKLSAFRYINLFLIIIFIYFMLGIFWILYLVCSYLNADGTVVKFEFDLGFCFYAIWGNIEF